MQHVLMGHLACVDMGLGTWDIAVNKTDKNSFLYEADLLLEGDRHVSGTYRMSEGVTVPLPFVLPHPIGVTLMVLVE